MDYDKNNIFAKFLSDEIKIDKFFENGFCIAFNDISPQAKTHILVVPKFEAISFNDFVIKADESFISGFFKSVQQVAEKANLIETGYRVIYNHGKNAFQSVFHFHVHILGGEPLSKMN